MWNVSPQLDFWLRKCVMRLLIHSSNIYQCLIYVSHMKGNDVEMSKSGIPSKYLSLLEGLRPWGWKYAGSSAFSPSMWRESGNCKPLSSQPSQPWHFLLTLKSLLQIQGIFQWESSLGAHSPWVISHLALPRELMGWTTPGWEPEGQPWRQGLCLQATQPAVLQTVSALLCLNLCSQRPSCSHAADDIRKPKQLFSYKDCVCVCTRAHTCVCCFFSLVPKKYMCQQAFPNFLPKPTSVKIKRRPGLKILQRKPVQQHKQNNLVYFMNISESYSIYFKWFW